VVKICHHVERGATTNNFHPYDINDCLEHKGDMSSFGSLGLLCAKLFVHENFQLFSAVLVENRQTYFGNMSGFVQDLAKCDCTMVTRGR